MVRSVLLNNVEHKDLRVITRRAAELGDNVHVVFTFPAEFRNIQSCFPVVFQKSADGIGFDALALMGLEQGENLFLEPHGWEAPYVPLTIERQPFLIGVDGDQLMVNIDMDHPRVSHTEGEAVFLPYGGNTEYLERINSVLLAIHQGLESAKGFSAAMQALELFEPFVVDIELNDGSQNRLMGFYTIHEERLAALDGATLHRLSQAGYLQAAYMVLASMSQFRALIDRKNARRAAGRS
jgi:hypothetical protein